MKKKLLVIGIVLLIVIIAIGIGIGAFIVYKNQNPTTNTEWGDKYLDNLKVLVENPNNPNRFGMTNDTEVTVNFIQTEENEVPKMLLQYEWENKETGSKSKYFQLQYIDNDEVKYTAEGNVSDLNFQFLYNIEKDEYNWYKVNSTNTSKEYISLPNCIEARRQSENAKVVDDPKNDPYRDYIIKNTIQISDDEKENKKWNRKNFEEVFILIKDKMEDSEAKFTLSMPLSEIAKIEKNAIEQYKTKNDLITDEVKQIVNDKKRQIADEKIKAEEAKKKAEEEATIKAAEEAKKAAEGFKVGKYTVKYGTYKASGVFANGGQPYSATLVLNADGTCSYTKTIDGKTEKYSGTTYVTRDSWYGIEYTGDSAAFDGIGVKWSIGGTGLFAPSEGNVIYDMEIKLQYTGN